MKTWQIDPMHSEIQFKVKHLVISTVTGAFKEFSGNVSAGEQFENANIQFEARVDSIDTGVAQRNDHLKSADFFDAATYPKIGFQSEKFEKKSDGNYELTGNITIKDVTKKITLKVEFGGETKDPYGNEKAGFEISGSINRKDFGLTWNALTETGSVVVSDEVKLIANVQLVKQAA